MKIEKFAEKAAKKFQKKLDKKMTEGALLHGYSAEVSDSNMEIILSFHTQDERRILTEVDLQQAYRSREEKDCSVKEVVLPLINETISFLRENEMEWTHPAVQTPNYIPEGESDNSPSVTPTAPIEEEHTREEEEEVFPYPFCNNVEENCGFPLESEYFSLQEFCTALKPFVAKKIGVAEEEVVITRENAENGESFMKLSIVGLTESEKTVNVNELYKDYRTSEDDDDKLLKKAAKKVMHSLEDAEKTEDIEASPSQEPQEPPEYATIKSCLDEKNVFPNLIVADETSLKALCVEATSETATLNNEQNEEFYTIYRAGSLTGPIITDDFLNRHTEYSIDMIKEAAVENLALKDESEGSLRAPKLKLENGEEITPAITFPAEYFLLDKSETIDAAYRYLTKGPHNYLALMSIDNEIYVDASIFSLSKEEEPSFTELSDMFESPTHLLVYKIEENECLQFVKVSEEPLSFPEPGQE